MYPGYVLSKNNINFFNGNVFISRYVLMKFVSLHRKNIVLKMISNMIGFVIRLLR